MEGEAEEETIKKVSVKEVSNRGVPCTGRKQEEAGRRKKKWMDGSEASRARGMGKLEGPMRGGVAWNQGGSERTGGRFVGLTYHLEDRDFDDK